MAEPVTASQAARALGITATRVRQLAPLRGAVVQHRRPMLVDLDRLRASRTGPTISLHAVAEELLLVHRADAGYGVPVHVARGIHSADAAVLLIGAFLRLHRRATGTDCDALPEPVQKLRLLAERKP